MKAAMWFCAVVLLSLSCGSVAAMLAGCAAVDLAKYKKDAAECRNLATCEEYVACRMSVERDAGSKWSGHCNAKDGGVDAR